MQELFCKSKGLGQERQIELLEVLQVRQGSEQEVL
jgi:hypothetical protein